MQTPIKNDKYTIKDSALMFILAIFLPYLVYFLFTLLVQIFFGESSITSFILDGTSGSYISAFIIQVSILIGVIIVTKKRKANFKVANRISFKLDYKKVLIVIAIGLVALFGFNWFSDLVTNLLYRLGYSISSASSLFGATNSFWLLLLSIFVMAIMPALCEELSMRGVILGGLNELPKKRVILISALMFMILHMSLEQCIYQFILGLVLALIVYESQNLVYSIILHLFNNATVLIVNFIFPQSLTTKYVTFWDYALPIIIALISLIIIYVLILLFKKLCEKNKISEEVLLVQTSAVTQNETEVLGEEPTNENVRDLPPAKFEYFDSKSALIISLIVGAFTWIVTVIAGFLI